MDYAKESLRLHKEWGGKIEVVCKVPCQTKDDLSLAYTPGEELNENYIIPAAFDPRVGPAVAKAVADAARKSGVARL